MILKNKLCGSASSAGAFRPDQVGRQAGSRVGGWVGLWIGWVCGFGGWVKAEMVFERIDFGPNFESAKITESHIEKKVDNRKLIVPLATPSAGQNVRGLFKALTR